jgi:predicted alpha/beta superfamily hydrolase
VRFTAVAICVLVSACARPGSPRHASAARPAAAVAPLKIGQTFHLESAILGERRTIHVYLPPKYATAAAARYPVLVLLDGGLAEDFLHIAGDVDISIRNEVIRPVIVVGIENTERRRDLLGPTAIPRERAIAPHAGGSDRFRSFLRRELLPYVAAHYRTSGETALIGESFAGLFVIETLLATPDLFDAYIAVDPSLWWNDEAVARSAGVIFAGWHARPKHLVIATADEPDIQAGVATLARSIDIDRPRGLTYDALPLPEEHHATIFPIAGVRGIRLVFGRSDVP